MKKLSFNLSYLFKSAQFGYGVLSVMSMLIVLVFSCVFVWRFAYNAYSAGFSDPEAKLPKPILANIEGYKQISERILKGRQLTPEVKSLSSNPFEAITPTVSE